MKYQFQLNGQPFGSQMFVNLVDALMYLQDLIRQAELREIRTHLGSPAKKVAAQQRLRQNIINNLTVVRIDESLKTTTKMFEVMTTDDGLVKPRPPKFGTVHRPYVELKDPNKPDNGNNEAA